MSQNKLNMATLDNQLKALETKVNQQEQSLQQLTHPTITFKTTFLTNITCFFIIIYLMLMITSCYYEKKIPWFTEGINRLITFIRGGNC